MAYTNTWDETAPLDTSLASLLGQDIRTFKTDIRQRVSMMSGTLANRPSPESVFVGLLYLATDTGQFFQWSGTTWTDVTSSFIKPSPVSGGGMIDAQFGITNVGTGSSITPQILVSSNMPALSNGQGIRGEFVMNTSGTAANVALGLTYNGTVLTQPGSFVVSIGTKFSTGYVVANVPGSTTSQVFIFEPIIGSTGTILRAGSATSQAVNTGSTGTLTITAEQPVPTTANINIDGWIIELI